MAALDSNSATFLQLSMPLTCCWWLRTRIWIYGFCLCWVWRLAVQILSNLWKKYIKCTAYCTQDINKLAVGCKHLHCNICREFANFGKFCFNIIGFVYYQNLQMEVPNVQQSWYCVNWFQCMLIVYIINRAYCCAVLEEANVQIIIQRYSAVCAELCRECSNYKRV